MAPTPSSRPCAVPPSAPSPSPDGRHGLGLRHGDLAWSTREAFLSVQARLPPAIALDACGLDGAPRAAAMESATLARLIAVLLTSATDHLVGPATVTLSFSEALVDDAAALRLGVTPGAYAVLRLAEAGDTACVDPCLREATTILARHGGSLALESTAEGRRLSVYLPIAAH